MTSYYSKCQSEFSLESKIDSKTKQYASKITKSSFFKQIESSTWEFKDELNTNRFKINVDDKHCVFKHELKENFPDNPNKPIGFNENKNLRNYCKLKKSKSYFFTKFYEKQPNFSKGVMACFFFSQSSTTPNNGKFCRICTDFADFRKSFV
ncbi:hypothetical protein BpHYR1_035982 [Brachionus plicatilis]|uniref:Uncharacterized protein n=1 Tax=Brachionus plicatilis TaxID=10195 RepID=A0A3M7QPG0_BRAPC|nr:hypothetical protein BpHYR1_035982 [Brachionus plicatilis]